MSATQQKCIYGGLILDVVGHHIESVTATTHQRKGIITLESNPSRGTVLPAPHGKGNKCDKNVKYERTDALSLWHQQKSTTVDIHGPWSYGQISVHSRHSCKFVPPHKSKITGFSNVFVCTFYCTLRKSLYYPHTFSVHTLAKLTLWDFALGPLLEVLGNVYIMLDFICMGLLELQ